MEKIYISDSGKLGMCVIVCVSVCFVSCVSFNYFNLAFLGILRILLSSACARMCVCVCVCILRTGPMKGDLRCSTAGDKSHHIVPEGNHTDRRAELWE